MSHARQLVDLYRQFYRASRYNSNSNPTSHDRRRQNRPDRRPTSLRSTGSDQCGTGQLADFMGRVERGQADGRLARGSNREVVRSDASLCGILC